MHHLKDAMGSLETGRSNGLDRIKTNQTLKAILVLLCLFATTSSHAIKCIQAGYTAEEGGMICYPSHIDDSQTREWASSTAPIHTEEEVEELFTYISSPPLCGEITYDGQGVGVGGWSSHVGPGGSYIASRLITLATYHIEYPPLHAIDGCLNRGVGSIYVRKSETAVCAPGYESYGYFYENVGGDGSFVCANTPPANECKQGNPVDIFSGNKLQHEQHIIGYGSDGLSLSWFYNAQRKPRNTFIGPSTTSHPLLSSQRPVWMHDYEKRLYFSHSGIRPVIERVHPANSNSLYLIQMGENTWVDALSVVFPRLEERPEELIERWKYTTPDNITEFYNPQGRLVKQLDSQGRATFIHYENDLLSQVSNWKGNTLDFVYDANGMLESVTDSAGYVYRYQFNADGLLTSVSFPDETPDDDTDNPTRGYRYEDGSISHALTGIVDENGQMAATWTYNADGRATSSSHAGGADTTTFSYGGRSTTVTNALGKETTYHYSTVRNLLGVVFINANKIDRVEGHPSTHCAGANTDYEYNLDGYVTKKTDWNGNETRYTRDAEGRELSRTEAPYKSESRTISTTWDESLNKPLVVTEPGRVTEYRYDVNGKLLSKTLQDSTN